MKSATGNVYIAQCDTRNAVKIGWTAGAYEVRRLGLRATPRYHDAGELLAMLSGVDRDMERRVHRALGRDRIEGELFRLSSQVQRFIDAVRADATGVAKWLTDQHGASYISPARGTIRNALVAHDATGEPFGVLPWRGDVAAALRTVGESITLLNLYANGECVTVTPTAPYDLLIPDYVQEIKIYFRCGPEWRKLYTLAPWECDSCITPETLSGILELSRHPRGGAGYSAEDAAGMAMERLCEQQTGIASFFAAADD